MIVFFVQGNPVPWQRVGGTNIRFVPSKTRKWKTTIAWASKIHRPKKMMEGPIEMHLAFYFKPPKKTIAQPGRGDCDNYAKSVMDALQGIYYENDNKIIALSITKRWGDPGVAVSVGEIDSSRPDEK